MDCLNKNQLINILTTWAIYIAISLDFLFDDPHRWQESLSRFKHIFGVNEKRRDSDTPYYYLCGNHDIGYAAFHSQHPEVVSYCKIYHFCHSFCWFCSYTSLCKRSKYTTKYTNLPLNYFLPKNQFKKHCWHKTKGLKKVEKVKIKKLKFCPRRKQSM